MTDEERARLLAEIRREMAESEQARVEYARMMAERERLAEPPGRR